MSDETVGYMNSISSTADYYLDIFFKRPRNCVVNLRCSIGGYDYRNLTIQDRHHRGIPRIGAHLLIGCDRIPICACLGKKILQSLNLFLV